MKHLVLALSGALVIVALALVNPAFGQDRGGSGGAGAGHNGGTTVGGGGGGSHSGGGGGASSGSGGSSSGGFSGGGSSSGGGFSGGGSGSGFSGSGGDFSNRAGGARNNPAFSGPNATARGGSSGEYGRAAGTAVGRYAGADPSNPSIPGGSRPNYGHPTTGTAVTRNSVTPVPTTGTGGNYYEPYSYYYNGYYNAYSYTYGNGNLNPWNPAFRYGYCGWGYPCNGLYGWGGLLNYDPFWSNYYYGSWFGMYGYSPYAYTGGYGTSSWYDDSRYSSGGGYSSSSGSSAPSVVKGGLKLKVSPKTAEVYVDGYYSGIVNDFNGAFQRLNLPVGAHRVELRAKGYQPVSFEVTIVPRDTISFHGDMQPVK